MAVNPDVHKFMCIYVQCASWLLLLMFINLCAFMCSVHHGCECSLRKGVLKRGGHL